MTSVGHHNLYDILLRPFANRNLYIATGLILLRHRLTVQTNIEVLRSPIGHTQLHRKTSLACCHTNRALLSRPLTLLTERHTSLVPRSLSRQIERNPHRRRTLLADEVSSLLILHVVLGTRSTATSGLRRLIAPRLRGIQTNGILIEHSILMLVKRANELVVEHTLVIVHQTCIVGTKAVQVLRELGEVVGAACFVQRRIVVGGHREHLRVGLAEHLAVAHTTHRIAIAALHHRPEIVGYLIIIKRCRLETLRQESRRERGLLRRTVYAQRSRHHWDVLVCMTCTDGVYVLRQRVEEGRTIEIGGGLQQAQLLGHIAHHLREARQSLTHSTYLAGNIHVPHLIAVARTVATLLLRAFFRDEGAIGQSVPHPEAHIFRDEQRFLGNRLVVYIVGNIDESGQLLVYSIIRCPHPVFVVVGAIHLYQRTMLGRNGVQIAVAVVAIIFFVAVEVAPLTTQLAQLLLRSQVASLEVAAQRVAPNEGALLAGTELVDHRTNALEQLLALTCIATTCIGHRERRHVVS